jgi:xylulokinase
MIDSPVSEGATTKRRTAVAYVIGVDVGTSGTKGLLVREDGKVAGSAAVEYGMDTPRPGWAEQDPAQWWAASVRVIRSLLGGDVKAAEVKAIGLTGQMHSSVFLDESFKVIRPALLWCDQRTEDEVQRITETVGFERLIKLTANRALTGFTAPKLLWLRRREHDHYQRLRHLLLAKDYLRLQLTGELATDVSDASGTLLFDVENRSWSGEILKTLDIDPAILPPCFEGPEITGRISEAASRQTGLAAGTPVVAGGGDQAAGAVGNGVVREGPVLITIGTSGVVFASADRPVIDPQARLHSFCHASPGLWHTMGVMLSAGGSLRWLRETLRQLKPSLDYPEMEGLARQASAGADGLIFLPYLTGERTPHFDPNARGVFAGLSLSHGMGHLTRAVMEGVAMGLKDSVRLMEEAGACMDVVYLSGGGAKSDFWGQLTASILGLPIKRLSVDEGPSFGAAVLALVGIGAFKSTGEAAAATLSIKDEIQPDRALANLYEDAYERFQRLYEAIREVPGAGS